MAILRKYGVSTTIEFELFEVDGVNLRTDWTPVTADCEVSKNFAAFAECVGTATDRGGGLYSISLTTAEMTAAQIAVKIVDAATKVFLDKIIYIETYGHTSAQHAFDLDTASSAQSGDAYDRVNSLNDFDPGSDAVTIADGTITSDTYDESTAFPLVSADTGVTTVAREGSDGSTHSLNTLSSQIGGISGGGSAQNADADSYTETVASSATAGTYTNTHERDGSYHGVSNAGGVLDYYYTINIGTQASPTGGSINGRLHEGSVPSGGDTVDIQAYNNDTSQFEVVQGVAFTGVAGSTSANDTTEEFVLKPKHVDSSGDVKIGIAGTSLETTGDVTEMLIDQLNVSFSQVGSLTGYVNGAYWIKATGVSGTVYGVNGTVDNPCPYADALTMNATKALRRFEVANGETVTLTADSSNFTFFGNNYNLALGGQTIDNIVAHDAHITGIGSSAADAKPHIFKGSLGAVTLSPCSIEGTGIGADDGLFTAGLAGEYVFKDCKSLVAGAGTPDFIFSGLGSTTGINNRGWQGGSSYTLDGDCTISHEVHEGGGQTIVTGGADVELRGTFRSANITLGTGTSETVQVVGITGPVTIDGSPTAATVNVYGVTSTVTQSLSGATINDKSTSQINYNGGAYALDTDANGRIRIVDGLNPGEINTNGGAIVTVETTTTNTDMRGTDNAATEAKQDIIDTNLDALITTVGVAGAGLTAVKLDSAGLDSIVVETGLNARQALSIAVASAAGKLSGAATTTVVILGAGVATTRITATVDASGNRSAVTLAAPT